MADALGLGPSGEIRGGSSPFSRTIVLSNYLTLHIKLQLINNLDEY
jgi:hypothetical protein